MKWKLTKLKRALSFMWLYITSPLFRSHCHLQDVQRVYEDIKRRHDDQMKLSSRPTFTTEPIDRMPRPTLGKVGYQAMIETKNTVIIKNIGA